MFPNPIIPNLTIFQSPLAENAGSQPKMPAASRKRRQCQCQPFASASNAGSHPKMPAASRKRRRCRRQCLLQWPSFAYAANAGLPPISAHRNVNHMLSQAK
jgi:hypothetical protein